MARRKAEKRSTVRDSDRRALMKQYSKWFTPNRGAVRSLNDPPFKQVSVVSFSESVGYSDSTECFYAVKQ